MKKTIYTILSFLVIFQITNYKVIAQIQKGDLLVSSGMTAINFSEGNGKFSTRNYSPISLMKMVSPKLGIGVDLEKDKFSTWFSHFNSTSVDLFSRIYPLEKKRFIPFLQTSVGFGKKKSDMVVINAEKYSTNYFKLVPSFGTQFFITKNLGLEMNIIYQIEKSIKNDIWNDYLPMTEVKLDLKAFYRFSKN